MVDTRRKWLIKAGLVCLGGFVKLDTFAAPPIKNYLLPVPENEKIRLSSNENPYGPSPMALKAMAESVNLSNRYQWKMILELMSAIAEKYNLVQSNVLIGAGSTQIIDVAIQLAAKQKCNFILADPTFSRWSGAAEKQGLLKITVPLNKAKQLDLNVMLHKINTETRMVYLCNPNNPTGTICKRESLLTFIKEATKNTFVLVDEAYIDYSGELSLSDLVKDHENLIIIKTFSKIYGLAGARIGYALGHTNTIEKLNLLQSSSNIGISAVSLAGALASLKDTDFVKESFLKNENNRSFTIDQLEKLNIPCIASYSNFIYFSLKNYPKDFFNLLKSSDIEGTNIFEEDGKWSRITVGTSDEMKKFINSIS